MELTVNVSTYCDRSANGLNVAFFDEKFFDFFAKNSEFSFRKNCPVFNSLKPVVDVVLAHFVSF